MYVNVLIPPPPPPFPILYTLNLSIIRYRADGRLYEILCPNNYLIIHLLTDG